MRKIRTLWLLGITLGIFVLFFLIQFSGLFAIIDLKIYDLMAQIRGIRSVDPNIVILAVDDASMSVSGQKWQWNRKIFADGLKKISQDHPKIILMDFMFAHSGSIEEDQALQKALLDIRPVKVVSGITLTQRVTIENASKKQSYIMVEKSLKKPVFAEMDYGFINIETGEDATIRKTVLIRQFEEENYEALTLKALQYINPAKHLYWKKTAQNKPEWEYHINFAGPNKTYPWVSYYQVSQNMLPKDFFKDKIVIIGPTFDDSQDFYFTPFFKYKGITLKMAGVEIHANLLDNLLNSLFLMPFHPLLQFITFFIIGLCFFALFQFMQKNKLRILCLFIAFFIFIIFSYVQYINSSILPIFYPSVAIFISSFVILRLIYYWKNQDLKKELDLLKTSESFKLEDFCQKYDLSKREKDILLLILQNLNNTQITKKLFISLSTVKTHITSLYKKTQVKSREELIALMNSWNKG